MQLVAKVKKQAIVLDPGAILGTGGEARVFAVLQHPGLVAKVYHKPTQAHAQKLKIMLANPPDDPMAGRGHISIAWPVDVLQSDTGTHVAGFLMPCVTGMNSILNFYNPQIRRQKCPLFTYQYLHRTAHNLAAAVSALHARGYVIGDLNESNILVADTSLVTVVDTDSFQVEDPDTGTVYRCPVGKPEFTPPELQGVPFSQIDRLPQHDLFGLGVLIFQLLMEGFHPFTGVFKGEGDPPPLETRISKGHFPYGNRWRLPYAPSPLAPEIALLHPALKRLIFRCFEMGHKHPKRRPDAQTWMKALAKAEASLVVCRANEQHLYGKHLRRCPWCERTARLNGRDPFPSPQALRQQPTQPVRTPPQTPLPAVPPPSPSSSSSPVVVPGSSVSVSGAPGKSPAKWLMGLTVLLVSFWLLLVRYQTSLLEPGPPGESEVQQAPRKQDIPEAQPHEDADEPDSDPRSDFQQTLQNRFEALSRPGLAVPVRADLYREFVRDFRVHSDARAYVDRAARSWEQMAFGELSKRYRAFQKDPKSETVKAVLAASRTYLQDHHQRVVTARAAMKFARWHLSPGPHPLKLYIDQGKKLYVKVLYNGTLYRSTKKNDRYVSVSLPGYQFTDTVWIEGYQDDRFEDTYLGKRLSVNSLKGNHPLKIADERGTIMIQVVYENFPGRPGL